jgi:hypothetical protein
MAYGNSMIKNELKRRITQASGVILTTMSFLAYQVKTRFETDLGEQADEVYLGNFCNLGNTDDLSHRWSHDRSSIFACLIPKFPSKESKEATRWASKEVSL